MGQERKPVPIHAATIWAEGGKIYLTFPGYKGTEDRNFNTVCFDPFAGEACKQKVFHVVEDNDAHFVRPEREPRACDKKPKYGSLEVLWSILNARCTAPTESDRKIGSRATPVQYDLEKVQRYMAGSGSAAKQDISHLSVDDMMKELGL